MEISSIFITADSEYSRTDELYVEKYRLLVQPNCFNIPLYSAHE